MNEGRILEKFGKKKGVGITREKEKMEQMRRETLMSKRDF